MIWEAQANTLRPPNTGMAVITVIAWSPRVPSPKAVRFGWHQLAVPNLANKEGLPASPFRTDRW